MKAERAKSLLNRLAFVAALLCAVPAAAQNVKISAMPSASALTGAELIPGVQTGANVKITGAQIKTYTSASPTLVTPNLGTPSAAVLTNATGLPLATGTTGVLPAAQGGAGTVSGALKANGAGTVSQAAAADLSNGTTGSGAVVLATAPSLTGLTNTAAEFVKTRVVTAAGSVTIGATDYIVIVNKTSGAATAVSLPTGVTGQVFIVKDGKGDAATNNITVSPAAGTIDGAASKVMNVGYQSLNFVYNGTEWSIF